MFFFGFDQDGRMHKTKNVEYQHTIIMSFQPGAPAPNFALPTMTNDGPQIFDSESLLGKKNLVILFFPMAFTGVCTAEMCSITEDYSAYEALDAEVVGISGDNPFAQAAWAEKEGIKLSLLSDYEHEVAETFKVAYDSFLPEKNLTMGGVPKRSAFVIDKEGRVRYSEVLESPGDLPNFDKIKTTLSSL